MNAVVKDKLEAGRSAVENLLGRMGDAIGAAIVEAGAFQERGVSAALNADVSPGLIGEVLDYLGRMQADLGHAALMLQGVHASLHEAMERLAPSDPTPMAGGGDGKTPPPKP